MKANEIIQKKEPITHNITWWQYIIPPCLLTSLTVLFYYPSLHYNFQFDDIANITKHFDIRHNTLKMLFFSGTRWISYWINAIHYSIGAFDPFSYRVGNVAIHTLNGILLFFILFIASKQLSKDSFFQRHAYYLAFLTSLLFLLHPVQTQTVSYVIQGQLEGLSTLSILSMIACLIATVSTQHLIMKIPIGAILFCTAIVACGTKEITIIAPLLMILFDWFFLAQGSLRALKKRLPLHAALAILILCIYLWFLKPQFFTEILGLQKVVRNNIGNVITQAPDQVITPWLFFISQFKVILHYISIFIWPFNISVEYDWVLSNSFLAPDSFLPFLGLLVIAFIIVRLLQHNSISPIAFAILWFFMCILPRSSIIPSPELLVDYKTYMASCGLFFLLASALIFALNSLLHKIRLLATLKPHQQASHFALVAVCAFSLGLCTMRRNTVWRSGIEFWHNMIKNAPCKARAYNNYGVELSQQLHQFEEAVPYFKKAISMDKNYPDPWNNLAVAYANLSKLDLAIDALKEGIKINPYYPEGYNNIASFYLQKKDLEKAEKALQMALKLRPYYGKAHFNLGRVYMEKGEQEKAWECFKNSCTKADFDLDHGFATYGQMSLNLQKYDDAIMAYEKVLRLNPDYPGAAFNLGNAYFMVKQYEKAISLYEKTITNNPQAHQAFFNIGETYFTMGNYTQALSWFEKIAKVKKQLPQLYLRSAQCLEKLGKLAQARDVLLELVTSQHEAAEGMYRQVKEAGKAYLAQIDTLLKNNVKIITQAKALV
jgi:protein O-mannosyl-transferase